jgi:AcrR family transcriptional regulator
MSLVIEGLRERKKRLMREQLSDTAARMFMERGFDGLRVAEVAEACGVSEKTVFNYFPTKEALLLDRLGATMTALRDGLSDPAVPPVEAALKMLDAELAGMTAGAAADPAAWSAAHRRGAVTAGVPQRHHGPLRDRGGRGAGRPGRDGGGRSGAADRGGGAARPVAGPVPEPAPAPGHSGRRPGDP